MLVSGDVCRVFFVCFLVDYLDEAVPLESWMKDKHQEMVSHGTFKCSPQHCSLNRVGEKIAT